MARFFTSDNFPNSDLSELVCSICKDIAHIPYTTECGHLFCKSCITTWLNKTKKCPDCRTVCNPKRNEWAERISFSPLKYHCLNDGCTTIIDVGSKYRGITEHMRICEHKLIECNICKQMIKQKDYAKHRETIASTSYCVSKTKCENKGCVEILNNNASEIFAHHFSCGFKLEPCSVCGVDVCKNKKDQHIFETKCFENRISELKKENEKLKMKTKRKHEKICIDDDDEDNCDVEREDECVLLDKKTKLKNSETNVVFCSSSLNVFTKFRSKTFADIYNNK